jgi:hypothetical protein
MDLAWEKLQEICKSDGFIPTKLCSGEGRPIEFKCARGGKYLNTRCLVPEVRERDTSSRSIGCGFHGFIKAPNTYKTTFNIVVDCAEHNHESSIDLAEFPETRRLDIKQLCVLKLLISANADSDVVFPCMKNAFKDKFNCTNEDISNYRR